MINPRWRGNRAKNYKTLQGNQCFSRFKKSRCLESLRINIFWKELIIAEVLSAICINSAEFLVKISLVKCCDVCIIDISVISLGFAVLEEKWRL